MTGRGEWFFPYGCIYIYTSKYVATHSSYSMYFIMYMYLKLEVSVLVPRYYVLPIRLPNV